MKSAYKSLSLFPGMLPRPAADDGEIETPTEVNIDASNVRLQPLEPVPPNVPGTAGVRSSLPSAPTSLRPDVPTNYLHELQLRENHETPPGRTHRNSLDFGQYPRDLTDSHDYATLALDAPKSLPKSDESPENESAQRLFTETVAYFMSSQEIPFPDQPSTVLERERGVSTPNAANFAPFEAKPPSLTSDHEKFTPNDVSPLEPNGNGNRYEPRTTLGSGGFGVVVEAWDHQLDRLVAVKMARTDKVFSTPEKAHEWQERAEAALAFEARLAARIEDPRVVPIHDLVRSPNGDMHVVMKRVRGTSLSTILGKIATGDNELRREYSLTRRLTLFGQICLGIAYAHDLGVVHRDLKPANIMVGAYGEVQIIDWGLARFLATESDAPPLPEVLRERDRSVIQGTIGYMAPEQASGDYASIDTRTDMYALGAILYELLTFKPPYDGDSSSMPINIQLLRIAAGKHVSPSKRAPHLMIPPELEAICEKALALEREQRYQNARTLAQDIEEFIEGSRRKAEGMRLAEKGMMLSDEYRTLSKALRETRDSGARVKEKTPRWASPDEKALLWTLEDHAAEIEQRQIEAFAGAVRAFHEALGYDRDSALARSGLAGVYWTRFEEAEEENDLRDLRFFEKLVRQYDDGTYALRLMGDGSLKLTTHPAGIETWIFTLREEQRRWVPRDGRRMERTPVELEPLAMGKYLVVLNRPGHSEVRYPVWIRRQQHWTGTVTLPDYPLSPFWVYIPGGPCLLGGDPLAPGNRDAVEVEVRSYAISRFPVTCGQYCEYLNSLSEDEAPHRVPRRTENNLEVVPCWWRDNDGLYFVPRRDRRGERWDPDLPITSIVWDDAQAFAKWLGRRLQQTIRLPSEAEWEKAGRGVDGRYFPWGNHFEPAFCKMAESRPGLPQPEVCGTFDLDESPYGVRDLAGGFPEWVDGFFDDQNLLMTCRGGGWYTQEDRCRLAARHGLPPRTAQAGISFRLVMQLHPES